MGIRTSPRPPWIPFFSQIALLYSQVFFLLVIPVVLVFHYAWAHDSAYGLFVLAYFPESSFSDTSLATKHGWFGWNQMKKRIGI
jgi:hypothetical protein